MAGLYRALRLTLSLIAVCGPALAQPAAKFDEHVAKAWEAVANKDLAVAESEFLEAMGCGTLRDGDYWGLSITMMLEGRLREAADAALQGLDVYPESLRLAVRACEALADVHDYSGARRVAKTLPSMPDYDAHDPVTAAALDKVSNREYEVTYRLDRRWLNADGGAALGSRPLRCLLPTDTPYQKTLGYEVMGGTRQTALSSIDGGWKAVDVEPADGLSCVVTVRVVKTPYVFTELGGPVPLRAHDIPPEVQPFLGRTQSVDPGLPLALAAGAEVRKPDWLQTVVAAQSWWTHNLVHGDTLKDPASVALPQVPAGLVYSERVLTQKVSRCAGLACAMAAVLRAAGVPTRTVGGAPALSDDGPIGSHAWIECWHPKSGWVPVDSIVPVGPAVPYYRVASECVDLRATEPTDFYTIWCIHPAQGGERSPMRSRLVRKWVDG